MPTSTTQKESLEQAIEIIKIQASVGLSVALPDTLEKLYRTIEKIKQEICPQ